MPKGAIVAIGGGSIGRKGPATTTPIDQAVIDLTGKKNPRALFLPTAQRDPEDYIQAFVTQYQKLGCQTDTLYLYDKMPSRSQIDNFLEEADLIYVGGGNALRMLNRWRQLGIDHLLCQAHARGTVLAGISAGAICWFTAGLTDCWHLDHNPATALVAKGLNLIPGLCNPHYHTETWRPDRVKQVLQKRPMISLGIDDNAALVVEDQEFSILTTQSEAWAYRTFWRQGHYYEERLPTRGHINSFDATLLVQYSENGI